MVRTFLPEYVAMTMSWFSALGCFTAMTLLIMLWVSPITIFTSLIFLLTCLYETYVAIQLWTKIR